MYNSVYRIYGRIKQDKLTRDYKKCQGNTKIYMFHGVNENGDFNVKLDNFKRFFDSLNCKSVRSIGFWNDPTIKFDNCDETICITFDDVRESVYKNAFPILLEYSIPFTLFCATDYLGQKGYINIRQLEEMSACELCTIGSHGVSHCMYRFEEDRLLKELIESKIVLESLTKRSIEYFAFPYGSVYACSKRNIEIVKNSMLYQNAFSTINASFDSQRILNPFFIPRINVSDIFINNQFS